MKTQKDPPKLEVIDNEIEFKFRLVSADGKRKTFWAAYSDAVYLDGYCGVTAYYGSADSAGSPRVITAEEFLTLACIGVNPNAN
mgnify:CR=1 FL=1